MFGESRLLHKRPTGSGSCQAVAFIRVARVWSARRRPPQRAGEFLDKVDVTESAVVVLLELVSKCLSFCAGDDDPVGREHVAQVRE